MSKLRRSLALIMALVMTVALLAGCGGKDAGSAPAATEAKTDQAVPEGGYTFPLAEKVEISGLTR